MGCPGARRSRLQFGETVPIQVFGRGAVRATATVNGEVGEVALLVDGKKTEAGTTYPAPITRKLGFADAPLALFEGTARIVVKPPENTKPVNCCRSR